MEPTSLGERLKFIRQLRGLSQVRLSELSGIAQSDISKIELGRIKRSAVLLKLAQVLECNPYWLETGQGQHEQPWVSLPMALASLAQACLALDPVSQKRVGLLLKSLANDPQGPWQKWLLEVMMGSADINIPSAAPTEDNSSEPQTENPIVKKTRSQRHRNKVLVWGRFETDPLAEDSPGDGLVTVTPPDEAEKVNVA